MNEFDKDNGMLNLFEEIKKTDAFYNSFSQEFFELLLPIVEGHLAISDKLTEVSELLNNYAMEVLSSTHSVIDKDIHYPEYRMIEELERMNNIWNNLPQKEEQQFLREDTIQSVKSLMIKHHEGIFHLSGNGFRLLELNTKFYNWSFASSLFNLMNTPIADE